MKIMSFNLRSDFILDFNNRWSTRKEIVYEIIKKYNCDIIGVQELNNKMFDDICKNILNYTMIGSPRTKRFFSERNDILVLKNYKVKEHKTFWLSEKPDKVGSSMWYSLYPRICTTAVVEVDGGTMVRVFNTHLDCLLPQAREYGLKKVGKFIEDRYAEEKLPIILMGDFNATPNSKVIKRFQNGEFNSKRFIAVQDVKKELYEKSTMSKFKGKEKGLHIDYIFVSEELEIVNADILKDNINGKYPSDHYPLIAEIRVKE